MGELMRLDIDYLRAFRTVLEQGGVTRAAQSLNLTLSAISHKISRLEDRIGRRLLQRVDGVVTPTSEGRLLLSYAERLLSLHDEAASYFRQSEISGIIQLGTTESAAATRFMAVLQNFRRLNPRIEVRVKVEQSLMLDRWLSSGIIDMAVLQTFVTKVQHGDLALWEDELVWVGPRDIPLDLEDEIPFVSFDRHCFYRRSAHQALATAGRKFTVVMDCPSSEGVRAAVRSGLGCALMGRKDMSEDLIELDHGLPRFPRICHVLRSANRLAPEVEQSLRDAVLTSVPDGLGLIQDLSPDQDAPAGSAAQT